MSAPASGGFVRAAPGLALEEDEIEITFIRSPGPGGQKVNKTATCAQLRFDARRSPSLPDDVRSRLIALAGQRATADGVIVIRAHRHRSRERNRMDAVERLVHLIAKAARPPKPRTKTKPTRASRERRIDTKKQVSKKKRLRGRVGPGE